MELHQHQPLRAASVLGLGLHRRLPPGAGHLSESRRYHLHGVSQSPLHLWLERLCQRELSRTEVIDFPP